ncbi:TonB-dependent receptor [Sphingomonas sp.]|uniref:TonB-dependent receptor domain-containing protein n=1 Tax=Sphingomonas sp. TaxID=28214 RepID=UPI0025D88E5D|nr:TonB-dependent receptor [Sphingomonas sp.]
MIRMISRHGLLSTTSVAAACLTLLATAAQAQEAQTDQPAVQQSGESEPIVVTGSRIKRDGFDASTPVSVVGAEEVTRTGTVNVEELLSETPQFVPSTNGGASSNTVPGGTADVNLRGFGNTRNLVLVNGRRFAIFGPEQVTDINTIPAALIERTEVVTGGSSAVYGSDAITGVVNFILRQDFEGVEARAQYRTDAATWTPVYSADLTLGTNFSDGRGNVTVSAGYLKRKGITRGERGAWAFDSLEDGCIVPGSGSPNGAGTSFSSATGAACTAAGGELGFRAGGSGDIPTGRFSGIPLPGSAQSNAGLNAAYAGAGLTGMGSFGFTFDEAGSAVRPAVDPADRFNLGPDNYLIIPQERWMINSFGHYDFNDALTGYVELHFSNNRVNARLAPSNLGVPTLFDVNNPYLTPAMQEVLRQLDLRETGTTTVSAGSASYTTTPGDGRAVLTAGKRYSEVGPRMADMRRNVFRVATGFRGDLGSASENFLTDLSYDVYYSYARSEETTILRNAISRSRIQASVLRGAGGAAPVCNIFGLSIDDACANAIRVTATNTTVAEMQVASGNISGNLFRLPAGQVGFSAGVEWRRTEAVFTPDSFLASGDVAGFNPGLPTGGSVSAKEVFGEVRVPLIHNTPMIDSLVVNGAFRYSDYDLEGVGGQWTYLGGLEWRPVRDVTFRGQYQRAIRAPNVGELYGGTRRSFESAIDPCSDRQPAAQRTDAVRAVCAATGVPAGNIFGAIQPNTIIPTDFGGNPNLGPEKSDTWTAGVVFTPSFLPRFRASVDYFNIELEGAIAALGGGLSNTLNLCYNVIQDAGSEFCRAVQRDPANGEIRDPFAVQVRNANTGALKTSGIDIAARYSVPLGGGNLSFATDWTYTYEFTLTPLQAMPDIKNYCAGSFGSTCGEPLPNWRGNSRITWDAGDFSASLRHRYIGSVTNDRYILPTRAGSATAPALNTLVYPVLKAQHYFDLSLSYDFAKGMQIYGGVNNLTGNEPPIVGSPQIRSNTYPATYDVLRQEFYIGAVLKF